MTKQALFYRLDSNQKYHEGLEQSLGRWKIGLDVQLHRLSVRDGYGEHQRPHRALELCPQRAALGLQLLLDCGRCSGILRCSVQPQVHPKRPSHFLHSPAYLQKA